MKPLFAIDLTTDKKNEKMNGEEFIIQRTSQELLEAHEKATETVNITAKNAKLPTSLNITKHLCLCFAAIIFAASTEALSNGTSLIDAYNNAPYLVWIAASCLVIFLLLKIVEIIKSKTVMGSDETAHEIDNLNKYTQSIFAELSVPENARELDILFFHYKLKKGTIKPCEKGAMPTPYINFEVKAFSDDKNLYLTALESKYGIPISSISKIRTVKKSITILGWNKNIGINEGIYKQYKLTTDKFGLICCKRYHVIEVNHNGEIYVIYIPDYELPQIEQLTGLKATQE